MENAKVTVEIGLQMWRTAYVERKERTEWQ